MASMRDIKRRIKSVGSTQQITKAMNLVSASKLQKAKGELAKTKPFYEETFRVIGNVINNSKGIHHPYLEAKEGGKTLIILVTSDRGLCGGYNANINKLVAHFSEKKDVEFVIVGSKGRDYFKRRGGTIIKTHLGVSEKPTYEVAKTIGELALEQFVSGDFSEVYLAYTEFITTLSHEPKLRRLLPVDTSEFESENAEEENKLSLMSYEPDEDEVLSYMVPKYINTTIFGGLIDSATCQQAARMTSMDSATENAYSMIDSLTLQYNRARQGAITQEITEIVSGANALE